MMLYRYFDWWVLDRRFPLGIDRFDSARLAPFLSMVTLHQAESPGV